MVIRILFSALLALLAAACAAPSAPADNAADRAAGDQVASLVSAESWMTYHYGMADGSRAFTVKVKNVGFEKNVFVHGALTNGEWHDLCALSYAGPAEPGYEFWRGTVGYENTKHWRGDFAIRCMVYQAVYWDNNGGANYRQGPHDGPLLGNGTALRLRWAELASYGGQFYGSVDIRNLGYAKQVTVVYSTDGWRTTKRAPAQFANAWYLAYTTPVYGPNAHGVEPWSFCILLGDAAKVEFAIAYEVNGRTYWDNNGGRNYVAVKPTPVS